MSGVQHFAAGVVMAALVGEVMPDLRQEGRLPWAVVDFSVGVVVMLSLGAWGRRLEDRDRAVARTAGYVLPVGLDLGDSILARPDPCPCGNQAPAIHVTGRTADILTFPAAAGD
ncbi:hypothetical protein GCM10022204_36560 [Microlunatus aurantiacus]|uniref:Uncharacterized protein n=1 Tax=Microlunatus aurantiacus TaxID=446786 RepID=A0ABP7E6U5_9ACTN